MRGTLASCGSTAEHLDTRFLDLKSRCIAIRKHARETVDKTMKHETMERKAEEAIKMFENSREVQRACVDIQLIVDQILQRYKRQQGRR